MFPGQVDEFQYYHRQKLFLGSKVPFRQNYVGDMQVNRSLNCEYLIFFCKVQNISTIYSCSFSLMMQFRFEKTETNGVHIFNCVKTIFLKAIYVLRIKFPNVFFKQAIVNKSVRLVFMPFLAPLHSLDIKVLNKSRIFMPFVLKKS